MTSPRTLSHLKALESESIEIFREVAAAFERPVLMYSIGKDSSVLLHLCRKAFHPAKIPFTALHIDTTWKSRDMKTKALRDALDMHKFDAAIGGARRDEEPSRSKERIFSVRGPNHSWDP